MSWPTASCGAEGEQQLVDAVAPGMEMGALSCGDLPDPMWLTESAFTIKNSRSRNQELWWNFGQGLLPKSNSWMAI